MMQMGGLTLPPDSSPSPRPLFFLPRVHQGGLDSIELAVVKWYFPFDPRHTVTDSVSPSCCTGVAVARLPRSAPVSCLSKVCYPPLAQLLPGGGTHACVWCLSNANDLMLIPVMQKGKCLCSQVFLVSRVATAVMLSPVLPEPTSRGGNTISAPPLRYLPLF